MAATKDLLIQRFVRERGHFLGFLRVLCRDAEQAEELFQELSVVVIEKIETFDQTRDFGAWVRGIARNLFLKACRSKRLGAGNELAYDPELVDSVVRAYEGEMAAEQEARKDQARHLRHCLAQLPEHLRQLVRDRYERNCKAQRLAEMHQRSVSAIDTALCRVRASLLDCIQRQMRLGA